MPDPPGTGLFYGEHAQQTKTALELKDQVVPGIKTLVHGLGCFAAKPRLPQACFPTRAKPRPFRLRIDTSEKLNCKSITTNLESQVAWTNSIPTKITTRCWARVSTLHGERLSVCTGSSRGSGIQTGAAMRTR